MIMGMLGRPRSSLHPGRIPRPRALAAALTVLIALTWLHSGAPVSATAGVLLPAEFGSEWVVIAGYTTFSHTGHDPEALDIVRVDGQTAGSLVLAGFVAPKGSVVMGSPARVVRTIKKQERARILKGMRSYVRNAEIHRRNSQAVIP